MEKGTILWVDDEMELLLPHILFLRERGYRMETAVSGADAVEKVRGAGFDLIFLDEEMPGLGGLETLREIRKISPSLPVVMVTRNEEEPVMDKAIGTGVSDYLIKPVTRNQLLLAVKKHVHRPELTEQTLTGDYRQAYPRIEALINSCLSPAAWEALYRELTDWELNLAAGEPSLRELLEGQRKEAGRRFGRFVRQHYQDWVAPKAQEPPLLSPRIFPHRVWPLLEAGQRVWLLVVDNLRWDQWRVVRSLLAGFHIEEEIYWSILPTATQYSRNALFAGLFPGEIARRYPHLWVAETQEEGKNRHEAELLQQQMERLGKPCPFSYHKINNGEGLAQLTGRVGELWQKPLTVVVLNFVDMLSHAGMENGVVRELAASEGGYREVTRSWFRHSGVLELLNAVIDKGAKVVLTTDHGTIRVDRGQKLLGTRETNPNVRYKVGRSLTYNKDEVYEVLEPGKAGLPSPSLASRYIFALGSDFFVYPNDYNRYLNLFRDTFQHGGISMEEILVPLVTLSGS
ncbi:MAG: bifunctional response regulator/alkaline phosphatase family protein [Tannerellaceae bacterium]|jgi:CheY-like chemotaxis protein|nr:bifunctional response regulator/alkaline phosphatase family protein [Tannerellaceae bacterium]